LGGEGTGEDRYRAREESVGRRPSGFELIGQSTFTSIEDMQAPFAAAGNEILEDIPKFTDVEPLIQINQPVER
jgi:hypothetical protein